MRLRWVARPMKGVTSLLARAVSPPDATSVNNSTGRSIPLSVREPIDSNVNVPGRRCRRSASVTTTLPGAAFACARSDVRGFANRHMASASKGAYHDASAVNPDPHLEIELGSFGQLVRRLQYVQRTTDRT
jgi:hypothetical protein